ncbi:MAG: hypothetical protein U0R52_02000 [Solirubrobacterales bacterium]
MQERLFKNQQAEIDDSHDPYEELRQKATALADEYDVDADHVLDLILSRGSERAARRALEQRWWLSDNAEAA